MQDPSARVFLTGIITLVYNLRKSHCLIQARFNGVEVFLYCQIEGAVSDETVKLARQQSKDLFFLGR